VGLLAGRNDLDLLQRTGVGRDINRHYYSEAELSEALRQPVVQQLCDLIRFRNAHPAFDGDFAMPDAPDQALYLEWRNGDDWAWLHVDFPSRNASIRWSGPEGQGQWLL